jgi:RHS repeat-associated protein
MRRLGLLLLLGLALALAAGPAVAQADPPSPFPGYSSTILADGPWAYYHLDDSWTFPLPGYTSTTTIVDATSAHRDGLAGAGLQPQRSPLLGLAQSSKSVEMVTSTYVNNLKGYRRLTSVLGAGTDGIRPKSDDWSFETWWDPQGSQSAAYIWGMIFEDSQSTNAKQGWSLVVGNPSPGYGSNVWDPGGWDSTTNSTRPDRIGVVTSVGILSHTSGSMSWQIPNFADWVTHSHHLVVTHRASDQWLQIYVDGVLRVEGHAWGCSFGQGCSLKWETPPQDPPSTIVNRWGTTAVRNAQADAPGVRGKFDEIALYKTILTASQVPAHYLSGGGVIRPDSQVPSLCLDPNQWAACATGADPVNTATGAYTTKVTDAALPGIGLPFSFIRYYSSASTSTGRLGPGWSDSYSPSLTFDGSGNATLRDEVGAQIQYTKNPDGSFTRPAGALSSLAFNPAAFAFTYSQQVLNDGPSLYWRLGETSGTTAADSSGNARIGTYATTYTLGQTGAVLDDANKSVSFTGGRVSGPSLSSPLSGKSFTVEAWVKLNGNNGNLNTVASVGANEHKGFKLAVDLRSGGRALWWEVGDNSASYYTITPTISTVDDGNWHQLVGTYTYSTRTLVAYYDGALLSGSATTGANAYFDTGAFYAAAWSPSTGSYKFNNGTMDELTVYPSALSASRIATHYTRARGTFAGYTLIRRDQVKYQFDPNGRLASVTDRNGQGATLGYDSGGNLTSVTDAAGRQIGLSYSGSLLSSLSLPDGRHADYGYTNGQLTSVRDLGGGTTSYGYDSSGRLNQVVDQNGHTVVQNTYGAVGTNDAGRVVSQTDGLGHSTTSSWDPTTQTMTFTDARSNQWKDVYAGNILWKRIDPLGNTTTYGYDSSLALTSITDANGNKATLAYDANGNLLSLTQPSPFSNTASWTYNSFNEPLTFNDFRGHQTTYAYDANGNLTSATRPGSVVTGFTYDPSGNGLLRTVTDPRGKTTTFDYDSAGDLTSLTDPLGNVITLGYDTDGRKIWQVDPRGNVSGANPDDYKTQFAYDDLDRLTSVTDPLGNATGYAYDAVGNRTGVIDPNDHTTSYAYDAGDHLTTVTAPDSSTTVYGYDNAGNLTSRVDGNGHETDYQHDNANRLTQVTNPLDKVWAYDYDANGNLTSVVDANGNSTPASGDGTTTYGHDNLNRLTSIGYSDSTPAVSFTYDANGNRASMSDGAGTANYTYDNLDRLTQLVRGSDTFSYTYDAADNVTERTYPGNVAADYTYDDNERLATMIQGGQTTTYAYDPASELISTTLPSGNGYVEMRTYDHDGRPTEVRNAAGGTTLSFSDYQYAAAGLPTQLTTQDGATTYGYDNRDRLTDVCFQSSCPAGSDPFIRYTYDAVGNRLTEDRSAGTTTYGYDAGDQLQSTNGSSGTTNYSYDANGNETAAGSRTLTYDLANRLGSTSDGSTTTTYSYDGDGNRLSASSGSNPGDTTNDLWDVNNGLPQLALERDGSGVALRSYSYGLDRLAMNSGGSPFYYHRDLIGSVVNVTSAEGATEWSYEYEPFGVERSAVQDDPSAPVNPIRFTGELYDDALGTYDLRAREYDPSLGRFVQTDPVASQLGDAYVASYLYADNLPTLLTDPSGKCPWCVAAGIGAVVGAVAGAATYGADVAFTSDTFSWRGLGGATAGGAVTGAFAGGTLGLGPLASAGVLGLGGTAGAYVNDVAAGQPVTACGLAATGLVSAVTGGVGAKLFPLKGVSSIGQVPYFAPRTAGALTKFPPGRNTTALYNQSIFGGSFGGAATAGLSHACK